MRFSFFHIILFVLGILFISSCSEKRKYIFATASKSSTYHHVGGVLSEVLSREENIQLEMLESTNYTTTTNCKLLLNKEVDFVLAQNDTKLNYLLTNGRKAHDLYHIDYNLRQLSCLFFTFSSLR